jgi:hypothetical protein
MVTRQSILTLRKRLLVAALGVVLVGGVCGVVLETRSPTQGPEGARQPGIIPHLVPDVGGLHSGSQGATSPLHDSAHPGIRLIPSAGGAVRVYGGAPSGAIFRPVRSKG